MKNKRNILIIEDDKYISRFIEVSLSKEGYEPCVASTAAEGMFFFSSYNPDMVLLDLGLPDCDGISVLREIREISKVPVLIVSARGQEETKIEALDLGADDYITKPFHMGELMARIRVIERRTHQSSQNDSVFKCDGLEIDFQKRVVTVDGEIVHLTPLEYKLLILLVENRGKVLTHNFIIHEIWGYDTDSEKTGVRVFMASLRRKIEKDSSEPEFILTEMGVGYRFRDK